MKSRSPPRLQHLILSKKTLEIQSVLAASPIFKKVGVSEQKLDSLLAYSSKYWKISIRKFLPTDLSSLFKPQQWLNPKKLEANMVKSLNTIRRGIAPPLQNGACSCSAQKKKKIPLLDHACKNFLIFSTYSSFVGNLAQNSIRLSLSTEPYLLIRSCIFQCSWHVFILLLFYVNNTLNITFEHETIAPRIFGRVSPSKTMHIFIRIFGNSKFSTKQKSCWCLFKQTSSGNSGDSLER
jgi:hypothetical protein